MSIEEISDSGKAEHGPGKGLDVGLVALTDQLAAMHLLLMVRLVSFSHLKLDETV
jgi:hypothetical protein